jgi:hypothetical protein
MPSDRYMDREDWARNGGYQSRATPQLPKAVSAYVAPDPVVQTPVPTVMAPTTPAVNIRASTAETPVTPPATTPPATGGIINSAVSGAVTNASGAAIPDAAIGAKAPATVQYDPSKSFGANMTAQTAGLDLNALAKTPLATDPAQIARVTTPAANTESTTTTPTTSGGPPPRTSSGQSQAAADGLSLRVDPTTGLVNIYTRDGRLMTHLGNTTGGKLDGMEIQNVLRSDEVSRWGFNADEVAAAYKPYVNDHTYQQILGSTFAPRTGAAPIPKAEELDAASKKQAAWEAYAADNGGYDAAWNSWQRLQNGGASGGGIIAPVVERAQTSNWNVTPEQTVAAQMRKIMDEDGVDMQTARAEALMAANDRGMINSSFAVGAAQDAVRRSALDIAKPDAMTYADAARTNAGASNQTSMFNAGQGNQWNTNQLDRDWKTSERKDTQNWQTSERKDTQNWQSNENSTDRSWKTGERLGTQSWQSGESEKDRTWKTAESGKDRVWQSGEKLAERNARIDEYKFNAQTQKDLKDIGFKYEKELNADANLDKQYGMFVDALFKIDSDPNLDAPAKEALKYQQFKAFESYAKLRGLKLDLSFGDQYKPVATTTTGGGSGGGGGGSGGSTVGQTDG